MKNQLSAIRTLSRFRTYTMINIIGLAVSVAATLIIVRYIHQEITVDHFCKDLDRLYLLTIQRSNGSISITDNTDRNNDPNFIDPMKTKEYAETLENLTEGPLSVKTFELSGFPGYGACPAETTANGGKK